MTFTITLLKSHFEEHMECAMLYQLELHRVLTSTILLLLFSVGCCIHVKTTTLNSGQGSPLSPHRQTKLLRKLKKTLN